MEDKEVTIARWGWENGAKHALMSLADFISDEGVLDTRVGLAVKRAASTLKVQEIAKKY